MLPLSPNPRMLNRELRALQARLPRRSRLDAVSAPIRFSAHTHMVDDEAQRQAELFYLQKQIQSQTPMVIVLEDGEPLRVASNGTTATR